MNRYDFITGKKRDGFTATRDVTTGDLVWVDVSSGTITSGELLTVADTGGIAPVGNVSYRHTITGGPTLKDGTDLRTVTVQEALGEMDEDRELDRAEEAYMCRECGQLPPECFCDEDDVPIEDLDDDMYDREDNPEDGRDIGDHVVDGFRNQGIQLERILARLDRIETQMLEMQRDILLARKELRDDKK